MYIKLKIDRIGLYFQKLRFGIFPLQVEIGRWQNIKFEDRVCQICHTGVEDENHLVFYCSGYNKERHNFENNMCSIKYREIGGHSHAQKN